MPKWRRFKVIKTLGSGSFGKTILVEDQEKNCCKVVLKVPHDKDKEEALIRELITSTALRARLEGISHPNIVQYLDLARFNDDYVIILEYVEGTDLRARIGPARITRSPMVIAEALGIFEQVCAGLAAAHHAGLMHRDIKPENILIREDDGVVKLGDFGISKILQSSSGASAGTIAGTPYYMAPEAWLGHAVLQSDIWSLTVTLYEMITGRVPFLSENTIELREKIDRNDPIPPRKINCKINEKLNQLILRGLDKNPRHRFQTVEEILSALHDAPSPPSPKPVEQPQKIQSHSPSVSHLYTHIEAAIRLFEDDQKAEAESQLQELERQYPNEAKVYLALGQLHSRLEQFAQAEEIFRRGVRECPDHAGLHLSLAMVLSKQGGKKGKEAIEVLQRALQLGLNEVQELSARTLLKKWQIQGGIVP